MKETNHRDTEGTEEGHAEGPLGGLTSRIIGAAIEVHRFLGPGLLESAYEACLAWELGERGMRVERQVPLRVRYKGVELDCGYRLDMVVDEAVIVDLKTVTALDPIHQAQVLTYLRLSGHRVGLILNFHTERLRQGIKRVIL
jgi:GxxExxY protein